MDFANIELIKCACINSLLSSASVINVLKFICLAMALLPNIYQQ